MFTVVGEHVFPFLRTLGGDGSTYAHHMRDARFTIPTPALLAKVVDLLGDIPMDDRDTKGDLYEYMLGKIATAGQNGQFRTPRHIISLMVEMLGLASMAELPCVVVDAQRGGPSTGMPTRHEQGDLFLTVFAGHGEVPKIVLSPTSVSDCFYQTINAFNLTTDKFDGQLERFNGNLRKAAVELTKDWRTDRVLRRLEAQLVVADVPEVKEVLQV